MSANVSDSKLHSKHDKTGPTYMADVTSICPVLGKFWLIMISLLGKYWVIFLDVILVQKF